MDDKKTKTVMRHYRRGETVNCRGWIDFSILETTIRGFCVQVTMLDIAEPSPVKLPADKKT